MSDRPSLSTLIARVEGDFNGAMGPQLDPRLRRSPEKGLVRSVAGATHGLYGRIEHIEQQITDPTDEDFLVRMAGLYNIFRIAAVKATGSIRAPATNGTLVPVGTIWQRNDGVTYRTNANATAASSVVTMAVTAVNAGADGNAVTATPVTLVQPIAGVNPAGLVLTPGIVGGSDIESLTNLHDRFVARRRNPPRAGTAGDFVNWAREVPGVTRVWPYANYFGPNTVGLAFVLDDDDVSIVPDLTKRNEVQNYVQTKVVITLKVFSIVLTAAPFSPTISITPDTTAIRTAVTQELKDLIRRTAAPGATLLVSKINEAISIAAGEDNHVLVSPVADVTRTPLQVTTLGAITWA